MPGSAETSQECRLVEGIATVHSSLREISGSMPSSLHVQIGDFLVSNNSAKWFAQCSNCLGSAVVTHNFEVAEFESQVAVKLPDGCPLKQADDAPPVMFYIDSPVPPLQQG